MIQGLGLREAKGDDTVVFLFSLAVAECFAKFAEGFAQFAEGFAHSLLDFFLLNCSIALKKSSEPKRSPSFLLSSRLT